MPAVAKPGTDGWERLSDFALILAIGLVICRCLMLEAVRDAFGVIPGQDVLLRSPNAAVTVILDLLSFLPALLVCVRGVWDRRFVVPMMSSAVLLAAIGVLATISALWSADRFTAAVSAGRFVPGATLAWAIAQCMRDWRTFRLICGVLAGLLGVLIVHSAIYVCFDVPQMQKMLEENRGQILKDRGFTEGSFQAAQFERKIAGGEVMGFCASPNSLAAMTVLIAMCLIGDVGQKVIRGRSTGTLIVPLLLLGGAGWIIVRTQSMTAMATPVLGIGLLTFLWLLRDWIARRRKTVFAVAVGGAVLCIAAVVAHGLYHGTLPHRSLTFRWQYWQGSFAMFLQHPWWGVGWDNFGMHYLAYRLPTAPEEIKDPHNLFVRFATELGVVGLLLALAWIGATAWAASRPIVMGDVERRDLRGVGRILAAIACGIVLSMIFALDWSQDAGVLQFEVLRKLMYGAIMAGVAVAFGATDLRTIRESDEPAPFLALAMGVALAVFLLHNMIDFAFFEGGPFWLSMLCAGAAMGLRLPRRAGLGGRGLLATAAVMSAIALAFGAAVVIPVVASESDLRAGDAAVARKQFASAERAYALAYEGSGWLGNADDLMRQAGASTWAGRDARTIIDTYRQATRANPRLISAYLAIADFSSRAGDQKSLLESLAVVLALNPTSVSLRIDAGEMFARVGLKQPAAEQYREALRLNDILPKDEPKRLLSDRELDIRNRLSSLEK